MSFLDGFTNSLLIGAGYTIALSVCSALAGLVVGFTIASFKLSRLKILNITGTAYTTVIRGVPELLLLLLLYFGGTHLLSTLSGNYVEVSPFVAGVFALSMVFAGYSAESIRAAWVNVDKGLVEAGHSLGMSKFHIFRSIQLPLVFRYSIPALGNLWLVLLKDSALVSVIGLEDLMRKTQIAIGFTKQPFKFFLAAAIIYLTLTIVSSMAISKVERSVRV